MAKTNGIPSINKNQLKSFIQVKDEEAEARRLWEMWKEKRATREEELLKASRRRTHLLIGDYQAGARRIQRRVPHYKAETALLAKRAGLDPDAYLEKCRNRGEVVTYWRFVVRGHEKDDAS